MSEPNEYQKQFPIMHTLGIESQEELEKEYEKTVNPKMPKKYKQSDVKKKSGGLKKIYKAD